MLMRTRFGEGDEKAEAYDGNGSAGKGLRRLRLKVLMKVEEAMGFAG